MPKPPRVCLPHCPGPHTLFGSKLAPHRSGVKPPAACLLLGGNLGTEARCWGDGEAVITVVCMLCSI